LPVVWCLSGPSELAHQINQIVSRVRVGAYNNPMSWLSNLLFGKPGEKLTCHLGWPGIMKPQ
jgi:hypothetical protein